MKFREYIEEGMRQYQKGVLKNIKSAGMLSKKYKENYITFSADSDWVMTNWNKLSKYGKVEPVGDKYSDQYSLTGDKMKVKNGEMFLRQQGIL